MGKIINLSVGNLHISAMNHGIIRDFSNAIYSFKESNIMAFIYGVPIHKLRCATHIESNTATYTVHIIVHCFVLVQVQQTIIKLEIQFKVMFDETKFNFGTGKVLP